MEPLSGISGNEAHRNGTTEQDSTSLQPFGIKPDMKEQPSSADKPEMSAANPGGENITAELLSGKSRDQEHVRDKLHFETPARMDEPPDDERSHSKPCSKEGEITDEAGTKENESIFEPPDQKVQLLASAEENIADKETPMDIEEQLVQMETGSAQKEEQAQPDETKCGESKLTHVENESLQEEKKTNEKDAIPVKKVESKEDEVGSNIYHEKEQVHQKVEEMHEKVGEAHQKKDKDRNMRGEEEKMDQEGAELHQRRNEDHRKDDDLNQKDKIHQQDKIHQKVDEVHQKKKEQVHQEEEVSQGKEEIHEEKEEVHQKQEDHLEKEEVHHQEKVHEKLEVHKKERVHEEEEVHHGKEEVHHEKEKVHHEKEEVHHQENIDQDKQEVHRKEEKMHQAKKETNGQNEGQSTNMDAVDEELSFEPSKKALAVEGGKMTKVDEADANSSTEVATVKDKTGLNAEDVDEDEEHVPLLERPAETSGRRERRAVERFSESTPDSKRTSLPLEEGRGTRLADCPVVSHCITNASAEELHALHQVVQGRQGRPHELRRNLRQFNGFPFERDSAAYEKKKESLLRYRANVLRTLSNILDLDKGKSREEMALAVLEFLTDPQPSGREVKPKQKAKQKPPSKKPERSSARKAAADAQGGGEEGESGTEEEHDSDGGEAGESEEEKPAAKQTQRKRTPAKRTPAKRTPAKRASARNTPAKKTPARKTPNRKSAVKKTPAKKTPAKAATGKKTPSKKTPQRKRKREEEPTAHSPSEKEEEPAAKRSRDKSGTKRTRSSTQPTPGL